jgi:hypothetical protein
MAKKKKDKEAAPLAKAVKEASSAKGISNKEEKFIKNLQKSALKDGNVTKKELSAIKNEIKKQKNDKNSIVAKYATSGQAIDKNGNLLTGTDAYLAYRTGKLPKGVRPELVSSTSTPTPEPKKEDPPGYKINSEGVRDLFVQESKRLSIQLVQDARDLLFNYDFSTVDSIPDTEVEAVVSGEEIIRIPILDRPNNRQNISVARKQAFEAASQTAFEIEKTFSRSFRTDAEIAQYVGGSYNGSFIPGFLKFDPDGTSFYEIQLPIRTNDAANSYIITAVPI